MSQYVLCTMIKEDAARRNVLACCKCWREERLNQHRICGSCIKIITHQPPCKFGQVVDLDFLKSQWQRVIEDNNWNVDECLPIMQAWSDKAVHPPHPCICLNSLWIDNMSSYGSGSYELDRQTGAVLQRISPLSWHLAIDGLEPDTNYYFVFAKNKDDICPDCKLRPKWSWGGDCKYCETCFMARYPPI